MTWPFENDTSAITKKIAKNDIDKNRVKKVFSLTTIVFATALLMMLVMFESGYETTKDRMAEGQPQVVFYDLSQQQIELLYSEENIESIKVTETENGYDASITIVDATKMTQYGFSSAVDNISSKYDIHHVAIASKEATIRQVGISIIGVTLFLLLFSIITFASTIITNIATKKREYAMFQSIGMTRKQTEKMALCESCVLAIGSLILTLILGIILGQILIKGLISAGIFYLSYTFPLALFTVYCIVVVLIILMITISAFYSLQKTPLVERLRIVD